MSAEEKHDEAFRTAQRAYQQGDLVRAASLCTEILAADPDFAAAMTEGGEVLNPLPIWEEPSRAAATRFRCSQEERGRDTAYHAKRAIELFNALAETASDPELVPLETSEAAEVQEHIAAIVAIFDRYTAKESSE